MFKAIVSKLVSVFSRKQAQKTAAHKPSIASIKIERDTAYAPISNFKVSTHATYVSDGHMIRSTRSDKPLKVSWDEYIQNARMVEQYFARKSA